MLLCDVHDSGGACEYVKLGCRAIPSQVLIHPEKSGECLACPVLEPKYKWPTAPTY